MVVVGLDNKYLLIDLRDAGAGSETGLPSTSPRAGGQISQGDWDKLLEISGAISNFMVEVGHPGPAPSAGAGHEPPARHVSS